MYRNGHMRFAIIPFLATLSLVIPLRSAPAAGFHGAGGGFGGFHGSGGFGGFRGGSFGGGGYRANVGGGDFRPGFARGGFSGFHAASSFGRTFSTPRSYTGTVTTPHYFAGRVFNTPHVFARTTRPFGDLGAQARTELGTISGIHTGYGRHEGHETEEFEHHHHYFLGSPFFYSPYFFSYLYPYDYVYPYYSGAYYSYPEYYYAYEPYLSATAASSTAHRTTSGEQFYDDALAAFRQDHYRQAAQLAAHALIDMPRQAEVHELMSLAMFALGDYRAAAMEAHAAVVLGPVADWPTLYSYYDNLATYTKQLDALAKYSQSHPASVSALFLIAYHDLMMGHVKAAKDVLTQVVAKQPQDKVAAALLKQLEGNAGQVGGIAALAPQPKR